MSMQVADRLEQALERSFGGRRFSVRPTGHGYVLFEGGQEIGAFTHGDTARSLWDSALDELERAGVIERCERCGDDRGRGAGWARFCGHCAEAFDQEADDDWVEQQDRRSA